jgi:hypothetical protein
MGEAPDVYDAADNRDVQVQRCPGLRFQLMEDQLVVPLAGTALIEEATGAAVFFIAGVFMMPTKEPTNLNLSTLRAACRLALMNATPRRTRRRPYCSVASSAIRCQTGSSSAAMASSSGTP